MALNLFNLFSKKQKKDDNSPQESATGAVEKNGGAGKSPAYVELVTAIDSMIDGQEIGRLSKQENLNMVTYLSGSRKILNINKNTDPPRTYFLFSGANHRAKELGVEGLRAVSKNEAKSKGYGPAKALYVGSDPEVIRSMLEKVT